MFKKLLIGGLVVSGLVVAALGVYQGTRTVSAQTNTGQAVYAQNQTGGQGNGNHSGGSPVQGQSQAPEPLRLQTLPPTSELDDTEKAGLLFMREEEKLARDVYTALGSTWSLPVFANIAQAEQTHMDSIKVLLDRYGLKDPAQSEVGVFTNPELQVLYNDLVARGSQSLAEAIKVGGAIEELDILDLEERLVQTDNADIQQVFNNLLKGSQNHLRAFASTLLIQTDETYLPQYLSQAAYDEIINASNGSGNGGAGGAGQGGSGQGGGGNGQGNPGRGNRK